MSILNLSQYATEELGTEYDTGNLSQYATEELGTEYDTGKTKITCYYTAPFKHDLTRLNGPTTNWCKWCNKIVIQVDQSR